MTNATENPILLDALTALKRARDQLSKIKAELAEPIAIVGMSCRFPGGANSLADYWQLLRDGQDAISPIPEDRWQTNEYYDADESLPGKMYVRHGGFLNFPVREFDAAFFRISPREAELMDPQHRLLLQVAWEALEQAGLTSAQLQESKTGVFIALSSYDYSARIIKSASKSNMDTYFGTGNAGSVAAGRISYLLGLNGPSLTVDTACSSSLVALHLACQSLHLGETEQAIVGGVNLMLLPETTVYFCKAKMLARDGHCKTFDASADGYVRSEGCGAVILKRLSAAKRDGDNILAVIRGSAVNQDGASGGLTVPNGKAQESVIKQALSAAKLVPNDVDYIEAHGTGTSLGDPIEYHALASVFAENRDRPLYLGSAKTNIGHLESAAGIAGVIKTVLALQHKQIPPHLHFTKANPHINLAQIPAAIPVSLTEWQKENAPRRAGISSFAFSGTNAHVIVEEAPLALHETSVSDTEFLITLSAKTPALLDELCERYITYLQSDHTAELADIAYTLHVKRNHYDERIAFSVTSKADFLQKLQTKNYQRGKASSQEAIAVTDDLQELALRYVKGNKIDWQLYYANQSRCVAALPVSPFQKQQYWINTDTTTFAENTRTGLFSAHIQTPNHEHYFQTQLSLDRLSYLKDHQLLQKIIFPGAGFVEWMLQAGKEILGDVPLQLTHLQFLTALPLHSSQATMLQVVLKHTEANSYEVTVYSLKNENGKESWLTHATAKLSVLTEIETAQQDLQQELPAAGKRYEKLQQAGFHYGQAFQTVTSISLNNQEAIASITTTENTTQYQSHPVMLDGCFQTLAMMAFDNLVDTNTQDIYVPVAIDALHFYRAFGNKMQVKLSNVQPSDTKIKADFAIYNVAGELIGKVIGFTAARINKNMLRNLLSQTNPLQQHFYQVSWRKAPALALVKSVVAENNPWLLVSAKNPSLISHTLAASLSQQGEQVSEIAANQIAAITQHLQQPTKNIVYFISAEHTPENIQLQLNQLLTMIQTLDKNNQSPIVLWLITENAHSVNGEVPVGFAEVSAWTIQKILALEQRKIKCMCIDLDANLGSARNAELLLTELQQTNDEDQVALRSDGRYVPRLLASAQSSGLSLPKDGDYQLVASDSRLIEDLSFKTLTPRALENDEVEITIKATALNFRDTLTVLGLYPGNPPIGVDCAGIVTRVGAEVKNFQAGDAVFGMVSGSFATRAITKAMSVSHKPSTLSFSEAATLPIVFLTAHYAFHHVMQLQKGQRVLIHTASGGLGLAAIQLAKLAGAEIFATAGSDEKRSYLRSLGIKHVFDSRSLQFAKDIMAATNQQGVDVVLNTLTGKDYIATTLSICSKGAYFLEVSKRDIWTDAEMAAARPDIHYTVVALDYVARDEPAFIQQLYQEISPLFEAKKLTPIPFRTYPLSNAIAAFQDMRQAKHIGKLVVIPEHAPKPLQATGLHVITGGLGALGLAVTNWLLTQGARHILLVNRSAPNESAQKTLAALQSDYPDARLMPFAADIAKQSDAEKLFAYINQQSQPLVGIMHAAGVLDDGLLSNQTPEKYARVLAPKMHGAWHLHRLSQVHDLDYFVMFSSIAALLGSPGQSNYAAANAYLDGLAHYRRTQGLPAQSINWGAWAKLGMATKLENAENFGIGLIELEQGLQALGTILRDPHFVQVGVLPMDWAKYFSWIGEKAWLSELKSKKSSSTQKVISLTEVLAKTAPEQHEIVIKNHLKTILRQILKLADDATLDDQTKLADLGVDSLMAMEFGNYLQKDLGNAESMLASLNFDHASIQTIYDEIAKSINLPKQPKPVIQLNDSDLNEIQSRVNNILKPTFMGRLLRNWLRPLLLFFCKIYFRVDIKGAENLPTDEPFIICANHVSSLDGVALLLAGEKYKRGFVTLIADNHFYALEKLISLFGDAVPFDRNRSEYAFLKNETYIKFFKAENKSFILFPEGTRSVDGKLQEFKQGIAWFAHQEKLKVVPAYIRGAFNILPKGSLFPKPRKLTITVGKPLTSLLQAEAESSSLDNLPIYQDFMQKLRHSIVDLEVEGSR